MDLSLNTPRSEQLSALVDSVHEERIDQLDALTAQHQLVMREMIMFQELVSTAEYLTEAHRKEAIKDAIGLADDYDCQIKDGPLCVATVAADPGRIAEIQQWEV